jgi:RNA binding chromodomain-containing protein
MMRTCRLSMYPRLALLALLLLLAPLAVRETQAQGRGWEPRKTWVFVVGTLKWKDSASFSSFDQKNRRDAEVVEFFRSQGVPPGQVLYLQDEAATTARIQESLEQLLSRTAPGDLLFLYYCGHGFKDDRGVNYFASFDASDSVQGWAMAAIPRTIEAHFKGSRALLAADCCYSGALANAVKRLGSRVSYAVLTSSSASQLSTGNWTFTEALLDGLRGSPGCDRDNNGWVTLEELGAYAVEDMATGEEQLAVFATSGAFDRKTVLSQADKKLHPRVGERVEVLYGGKYWPARIVDVKGARIKVHWLGVKGYADEFVEAGTVRPLQVETPTYRVGANVEVEWKGKWYPAKVLEVKGPIYYIHYTGYGNEWDEWVSSKRMRPPMR